MHAYTCMCLDVGNVGEALDEEKWLVRKTYESFIPLTNDPYFSVLASTRSLGSSVHDASATTVYCGKVCEVPGSVWYYRKAQHS